MFRTKDAIMLEDFSGGLNTKAGPLQLEVNETPSCINVITNVFKTLRRRDGQLNINSTALSELSGNGLYDFAVNSATDKLIGAFGTKIFYMDNLDGTWNQIKTGMTSSIYQFDNFVDNTGTSHMIAVNSANDTPQQWNGVAATTSDISAMPKGTAVKIYRSFAFTTGMTATPSRIQFSDLADFTTWPPQNYYDEVTPDGDGGEGYSELQGILYWFKHKSIFRVSYTGSAPLFTRRQVTNIGTIAMRTVKNVVTPDKGELLIFLGPDGGLYEFDGSTAIPISIKIEEDNGIAPVSLGTIVKNKNILKNAWAINDEIRHWYILVFTNNDSVDSTNNAGIVWDYYANSFWPFSNMDFLSGTMMTNNSGQKIPVGAGYDGKAYFLENGNNDSGNNISSYWTSRRLDTSSYVTLKKSYQLWATLKTVGNFTISSQYRTNWNNSFVSTEPLPESSGEFFLGSTFILGTATLGGNEALTRIFDIPRVQNLIQFKISDNSQNPRWNLYRLDMPETALGIASST